MKHFNSRIIFVFVLTILISLLAITISGQTTTVYFLVADPNLYPLMLGDSYILPLSDSADIAYARQLINDAASKIVVARIVVGSDGINRDMMAPGNPLWSWHVKEFLGFTDLEIELCDGSPTLTEGEVQNWAPGTEGQICYWAYTVVDEVPPSVPAERSTWGRIKSLLNQ